MKKDFAFALAIAATAAFPLAAAAAASSPPILTPPPPATARPAAPPAPSPPAVRAAMTALQRVCLPVLRGAPLKASAKGAGFRMKDGAWTMTVAHGRRIGLEPPDTANPHVCALHILAEAAAGPSMRATLAAWAASQSPPLKQVEADVVVPGPAFQHVTSTWTAQTRKGAEGVVLSQDEALPGKPALAGTRQSALLVSLTPA